MEGVPEFLRNRGWVRVGASRNVRGNPGTLDGYLKNCLKRHTADCAAVVLELAGVVELRQRIQGSDEAQAWRLAHLAGYRAARSWMIPAADLVVDVGCRTPAEAAQQIADATRSMSTSTP